MRTVFDAACNLLAWLFNTAVWDVADPLTDRLRDVLDAGGKWARQTDPKDD